jgi:hypothetical protein
MQRRRIRAALVAAAVTLGIGVAANPASAHQSPKYDYYLALGDSLASGVQSSFPSGQQVISGHGYADMIAHDLKSRNDDLRFKNLSCPGEDTTSMIVGGCPFPHPYANQLSAATSFLAAHRHSRILVTIDIGANNVDGCVKGTGVDPVCAQAGLQRAVTDLRTIIPALKAAAGPKTKFAAMDYYDPFLAIWFTGPAGQAAARTSAAFSGVFNQTLGASFAAAGIPVAKVGDAFSTQNFTTMVTLRPGVVVPLNVARICEWTWMCFAPPVGPNIHANTAGYDEITEEFEELGLT